MHRSAKKLQLLVIYGLIATAPAFGNFENILLLNNDLLGGWQIFGYGIMDRSADIESKEILLNVSWSESIWGVGGMYTLPQPVDGHKLYALRARVRTLNGTSTQVYAGVSTADDANLIIPRSDAIEITDEWQVVTFPITDMIKDKPNIDSPTFTMSDWDKIQIVKLLFTKPEDEPATDLEDISIQSPELIFMETPPEDLLTKKRIIVLGVEGAKGYVAKSLTSEESAALQERLGLASGTAPDSSREAAWREGVPATDDMWSSIEILPVGQQPEPPEPAKTPDTVPAAMSADFQADATTAADAPASSSGTPKAETAEDVYHHTIEQVEDAEKRGQSRRDVSNIYLRGAGKCRDLGHNTYTLEFFEEAVNCDNTNAYAYRSYGDYLMGYRGLYEQAAAKYHRARELVDADPTGFDDSLKTALRRSIHILHRDGRDGLPLYLSKTLSLYLEPEVKYKRPSVSPFDLASTHARAETLILGPELLAIPNPPNSQAQAVAAQALRYRLANLPHDRSISQKVQRRTEDFEYSGNLLLRFGNENLPYFRFKWTRTELQDINNVEDLSFTNEGDIKATNYLLGKNFLVNPVLDLNLEFQVTDRRFAVSPGRDVPNLITVSKVEQMDYAVESKFTYHFGTNTLKLNLGWKYSDIDRYEGTNLKALDDAANEQMAVLRLSMFGTPEESENPSRFRGRRSDHYEIGIRRLEAKTEVDFSPNITILDVGTGDIVTASARGVGYRPHITAEFLGLLQGHLDLSLNYNMRISDQPNPISEGHIDEHQFRLTPTWVSIYELYSEDFSNGWEFLSVSLPATVTYAQTDGDFNRYTAGVTLDGVWTTPYNVRLFPKLGFDFGYYPDIDRSDWGVFAEVSFRY